MMKTAESSNGERARKAGESLVQRAIDAVRNYIAAKGLRVGDSLPSEAYFAAEQGVSRAVVREAFGALGALRLLDVGNGRRARVGALDGSVMAAALGHGVTTAQISVAEVWDVRRTIEMRTAALAAEQRTSDEAAEIVALAEAMAADRDDMVQKTRHDIAFHKAIAAATHNAMFTQLVASFGELMEVAVPAAWATRTDEADKVRTIDYHRAIARAIADGDAAAAAETMGRHFDASIGNLLRGGL